MARYDIRFFDHTDRVYSRERVQCEDDARAVAKGHEINLPGIGAGFEVWQDERLVYRATRPIPVRP